MNDEPSPSTPESQPDPQPVAQPEPPGYQPVPQQPTVSATSPTSTRVAMVGAAAALVIIAGATGFALGRTSADHGNDLRFPISGYSHPMQGPGGWGGPGQPPGQSWNNGQDQSGPGA